MRRLSPAERREALAALGLSERATGRQITHAYRRLARQTHPDATGRTDDQAGRRFAAISAAYQLLTDQPAQQPPVPDELSAPPAARRTAPARSVERPGRRPPIVAGPVIITPSSPAGASRERGRR